MIESSWKPTVLSTLEFLACCGLAGCLHPDDGLSVATPYLGACSALPGWSQLSGVDDVHNPIGASWAQLAPNWMPTSSGQFFTLDATNSSNTDAPASVTITVDSIDRVVAYDASAGVLSAAQYGAPDCFSGYHPDAGDDPAIRSSLSAQAAITVQTGDTIFHCDKVWLFVLDGLTAVGLDVSASQACPIEGQPGNVLLQATETAWDSTFLNGPPFTAITGVSLVMLPRHSALTLSVTAMTPPPHTSNGYTTAYELPVFDLGTYVLTNQSPH